LFVLVGLFAIYSGRLPLDPGEKECFQNLTWFDHVITGLAGAINIMAAILLFRLRKSAVELFGVGLTLNVGLTIWATVRSNWLQLSGSGGGLIGLGLAFLILLYSLWLRQKEIMT
jgi:glucose dehydrogenase